MGDAARRKKNDPHYGKPRRGIVISNPIAIDGAEVTVKSSSLDPQELRFHVLFWDDLVWPASNIIMCQSNADAEFLEAAGVLSRPRVTAAASGSMSELMAQTHVEAFLELERKEPGRWALAQGEKSFIADAQYSVPKAGIQVELNRAIPVPDVDVALEDILNFKAKRLDELLNLRTRIDGFAAEVESSEDQSAALNIATGEIDRACADVLRIASESSFPIRLSDVKITTNLNVGGAALGALAGADKALKLAQDLHLHQAGSVAVTLFGAAAGAMSGIKLSQCAGWRGLKKHPGAYKYVTSYHSEVFGI